MRLILATAVLCLCATSAYSYSAVSLGEEQGGRLIYGYKADAPTQRAAIEESNNACNAAAVSNFTLVRQCHLFDAVTHGCYSLYTSVNGNHIGGGHGFDQAEARFNAAAVCQDTGATCQEAVTFCDNSPVTWIGRQLLWPDHATDAVQSWWTEDVTTLTLVAFAAFLVLAAGLAYAVFKLRQLRHTIAKLNSPARVNDPAHVLEEDITKTVRETFPRPIPEPSKEPKLDTKAIKEAFKSRRQEFEV